MVYFSKYISGLIVSIQTYGLAKEKGYVKRYHLTITFVGVLRGGTKHIFLGTSILR